MENDPLELTPLHTALAGLFAVFAIIVAATGWWEALNLDLARSMTFARPGRPIETGWQPIAVGVVSMLIGGGVAQGVLNRGFSVPGERIFLGFLLAGMLALAVFGAAGIFAGIEAFALLEQSDSGRPK